MLLFLIAIKHLSLMSRFYYSLTSDYNALILHYISPNVYVLDINECLELSYPCASGASCTNTYGSYTCTCNSGYSGDGSTCEGLKMKKHVQSN